MGIKKVSIQPWPVWLNWLEHHPIIASLQFHSWSGHIPSLQVESPVQACAITRPDIYNLWSSYGRQPIGASLLHWCFSLSLPLSLFFSLKARKKKMSSGEEKKKGHYSVSLTLSKIFGCTERKFWPVPQSYQPTSATETYFFPIPVIISLSCDSLYRSSRCFMLMVPLRASWS